MPAHALHTRSKRPTSRQVRALAAVGLLLCAMVSLPAGAQTSGQTSAPGAVQNTEPAADPFYRRASACVAVMKREVVSLKQRLQAGAPQLRPQMVKLTELGFTFIGTAYKRGLRKEQADALLAEAETAQKTQAADGLKKLSSDCQAEGSRLLAKANVIERALVSNRARARVDDLLAPPEPRK